MTETGESGNVEEKVKTIDDEIKETESTGLDLSSGLRIDTVLEAERTILVSLKDHEAPVVTMTGFWDGNLLKAAMRSIEKQYDQVRRHATVYAMKKSQQNI